MNQVRRSGTGLGQATIVVADRYPLTYPGDTGSLTDSVAKIVDPNGTRNPNRIIGLVGGAAVGYLLASKTNKWIAILGAAGGYWIASQTDKNPNASNPNLPSG